MKKFLVLYSSTTAAQEQMAKATPEQAKAGMDAWMKWAEKAGPSIVELGMPLGTPQTVTPKGASAGESKVAGYSVLQGESAAAVAKVLEGHPHFMMPGNGIEILEMLPLPGM